MKRDLLEKKNPLLAFQLLETKKEGMYGVLPLPSEETVACYISEIGSLEWQDQMRGWLKKNPKRRLYFLPDRVEDLLLIDVKLLDMPQFHLIHAPEGGVWDHLFDPWEWLGRCDREGEMVRALREAELTVGLYRDCGAGFLKNLLRNSQEKSLDGTKLKGTFNGIPAIICGAGVSLEKQLELLKSVQDEAFLLGGGSALAPLSKEGIKLDLMGAIDPKPPHERFYRQTYFETPLIYQRQVDATLLQTHQGPKVTFGRSGMFPIEEILLEDEVIDVGWTVTTFLTAVATGLGCNPIYYVGVDLCQLQEKRYAEGVEGSDERQDFIESVDRFGNPVFTRPDFIAAKEWLELFATHHPDTQFINLSEGLTLEGIPFGSFEKTEKKDLKGKLFSSLQSLPERETITMQFQKSRERVEELLQKSLEALEEGKQTLLYDIELEEEPFYQWHLLACWEVWKHLLQKEEVISTMKSPEIEKKVQQLLFFLDITERLKDERTL